MLSARVLGQRSRHPGRRGRARPAPAAARWPLRAEHVVLAAAGVALTVLVVLPLASLVWGSVSADGRVTLEHFREALSRRLFQ